MKMKDLNLPIAAALCGMILGGLAVWITVHDHPEAEISARVDVRECDRLMQRTTHALRMRNEFEDGWGEWLSPTPTKRWLTEARRVADGGKPAQKYSEQPAAVAMLAAALRDVAVDLEEKRVRKEREKAL